MPKTVTLDLESKDVEYIIDKLTEVNISKIRKEFIEMRDFSGTNELLAYFLALQGIPVAEIHGYHFKQRRVGKVTEGYDLSVDYDYKHSISSKGEIKKKHHKSKFYFWQDDSEWNVKKIL